MYGSFKHLISKPDLQPIPREMLDFFNETIPDGFEYRYTDNDQYMCYLSPMEGKSLHFDKLTFDFTDKQQAILEGEPINERSITLLMENALEAIEVDLSEAILKLDRIELPAGCLTRTVSDNNHAARGRLFISKKPLELKIPLGNAESRILIELTQVPSNNLYVKRFKSKNSALILSLDIDEKEEMLHFKTSFDSREAQTIAACRDAARIYDELRVGNATVLGIKSDAIEDFTPIAPFWNKAVAVQETLGLASDLAPSIDGQTVMNIERLHRCFFEGKAVGLGYKPTSLNISAENHPIADRGSICRFMFHDVRTLALFGEEVKVNACIGISGVTLDDPTKVDDATLAYSLNYTDDYQCSIYYLATSETDDSPENVNHIADILFAPLPEGRRH